MSSCRMTKSRIKTGFVWVCYILSVKEMDNTIPINYLLTIYSLLNDIIF